MPADLKAVESLLSDMPVRRRPSKFERWIEEDPALGETFWAFIEAGQDRGHSIEDLLALWATKFDPCPVTPCRIRERLRERRRSA